MPVYTFKCQQCLQILNKQLSISEFLQRKKQKIKCNFCLDGVLSPQIIQINSSIEKSQDQILMDAKEDIRKTIKKIESGDQKEIDDIYGDRPNPYK